MGCQFVQELFQIWNDWSRVTNYISKVSSSWSISSWHCMLTTNLCCWLIDQNVMFSRNKMFLIWSIKLMNPAKYPSDGLSFIFGSQHFHHFPFPLNYYLYMTRRFSTATNEWNLLQVSFSSCVLFSIIYYLSSEINRVHMCSITGHLTWPFCPLVT